MQVRVLVVDDSAFFRHRLSEILNEDNGIEVIATAANGFEATKKVIEYDLSEWTILHKGQPVSLKTREDWQAIWDKREIKPAQKIAFKWSLLPTRQRYEPADYNWGMTVYPVKHGSIFDLHLTWKVNGQPQQATIKNIQCAKDIYIAPPTE